jgi:thiol-disulfide isomerase/thioredoxin
MRCTPRFLAPLAAALALALAGSPVRAADAPIRTDAAKPVPALTFLDFDGLESSLEAFRGKVVVLNLWATWCVPCREEMPALDRLQAHFADQPVVVLALSVDRAGADRVRAFLDEIGVAHLHVYRDPKAAATRALRVPGLPATILIDRAGQEVGRVLGIAAWDGPEAVEVVNRLVAGPSG